MRLFRLLHIVSVYLWDNSGPLVLPLLIMGIIVLLFKWYDRKYLSAGHGPSNDGLLNPDAVQFYNVDVFTKQRQGFGLDKSGSGFEDEGILYAEPSESELLIRDLETCKTNAKANGFCANGKAKPVGDCEHLAVSNNCQTSSHGVSALFNQSSCTVSKEDGESLCNSCDSSCGDKSTVAVQLVQRNVTEDNDINDASSTHTDKDRVLLKDELKGNEVEPASEDDASTTSGVSMLESEQTQPNVNAIEDIDLLKDELSTMNHPEKEALISPKHEGSQDLKVSWESTEILVNAKETRVVKELGDLNNNAEEEDLGEEDDEMGESEASGCSECSDACSDDEIISYDLEAASDEENEGNHRQVSYTINLASNITDQPTSDHSSEATPTLSSTNSSLTGTPLKSCLKEGSRSFHAESDLKDQLTPSRVQFGEIKVTEVEGLGSCAGDTPWPKLTSFDDSSSSDND